VWPISVITALSKQCKKEIFSGRVALTPTLAPPSRNASRTVSSCWGKALPALTGDGKLQLRGWHRIARDLAVPHVPVAAAESPPVGVTRSAANTSASHRSRDAVAACRGYWLVALGKWQWSLGGTFAFQFCKFYTQASFHSSPWSLNFVSSAVEITLGSDLSPVAVQAGELAYPQHPGTYLGCCCSRSSTTFASNIIWSRLSVA